MKATGIVRRIDELGRIVIPKEIRKNLRIKEGDNLEIYVENEDRIVLQKYSLIKQLDDFSQEFTDSIYSFIKHNVLITDTDYVIAASGSLKKDYLKKGISEQLDGMLKRRIEILENHVKKINIIDEKAFEGTYTISPIIVNGDTAGLVMILSEKDILTDNEFKMTQIASKFLKNYLE